MSESERASDGGHWSAVPGVYPGDEGAADEASTIVDVDGERFAIRPDEFRGTHYNWLSGPNAGYGFTLSPTPDWTLDEHRATIRDFLAQIDPATGYLAD